MVWKSSCEAGVMLRFPNTLGVIFGAEMTQIAWRARMVGSARCADRTPQRGVPTVVLTRIDFERLTNDVISSEALQRNAKHEARLSSIQLLQLLRVLVWLREDYRFVRIN